MMLCILISLYIRAGIVFGAEILRTCPGPNGLGDDLKNNQEFLKKRSYSFYGTPEIKRNKSM